MTAGKFPAAVLALADVFGELPNFPALTLNGAINASVTSIVVNEAIPATWPTLSWLTIDSEIMRVTSYNAGTKTFTVAARDGSAGNSQSTTAASHLSGASVFVALTAQQWNQIVAEVIAVETALGKGVDLASASTLTLGTDGSYFHVTGTTGITAISARVSPAIIVLKFDSALTVTYNATSLILAGAQSMLTQAGDTLILVSEGSGNWREVARRTARVAGQDFSQDPTMYEARLRVDSTNVGVDLVGGTGTASVGLRKQIQAGANANSFVRSIAEFDNGSNASAFPRLKFFRTIVAPNTSVASHCTGFVGVAGINTAAAYTATEKHIGFRYTDAGNWFATVASGTTETTLDTGLASSATGTMHLFAFTYDGTTATFYVDGVNKGTITTNLPTGTGVGGMYLTHYIDNGITAADRGMLIVSGHAYASWI